MKLILQLEAQRAGDFDIFFERSLVHAQLTIPHAAIWDTTAMTGRIVEKYCFTC